MKSTLMVLLCATSMAYGMNNNRETHHTPCVEGKIKKKLVINADKDIPEKFIEKVKEMFDEGTLRDHQKIDVDIIARVYAGPIREKKTLHITKDTLEKIRQRQAEKALHVTDATLTKTMPRQTEKALHAAHDESIRPRQTETPHIKDAPSKTIQKTINENKPLLFELLEQQNTTRTQKYEVYLNRTKIRIQYEPSEELVGSIQGSPVYLINKDYVCPGKAYIERWELRKESIKK